MNTPQDTSLFELDGLDEQEETLNKAKIVEAIGATQLQHHIATTSTGSGGDDVHDSGIIHGPEPPPASSRSLLDYFRPSRRTQASRPSQGVQTTATSSASHGVQTTATSSTSQGVQTAPMVTNLLNPRMLCLIFTMMMIS